MMLLAKIMNVSNHFLKKSPSPMPPYRIHIVDLHYYHVTCTAFAL